MNREIIKSHILTFLTCLAQVLNYLPLHSSKEQTAMSLWGLGSWQRPTTALFTSYWLKYRNPGKLCRKRIYHALPVKITQHYVNGTLILFCHGTLYTTKQLKGKLLGTHHAKYNHGTMNVILHNVIILMTMLVFVMLYIPYNITYNIDTHCMILLMDKTFS